MLAEERSTNYLDACISGGLTVYVVDNYPQCQLVENGFSQKKPIGFYPRLIELILPQGIAIRWEKIQFSEIAELNTDSSNTNRIVIGGSGVVQKHDFAFAGPCFGIDLDLLFSSKLFDIFEGPKRRPDLNGTAGSVEFWIAALRRLNSGSDLQIAYVAKASGEDAYDNIFRSHGFRPRQCETIPDLAEALETGVDVAILNRCACAELIRNSDFYHPQSLHNSARSLGLTQQPIRSGFLIPSKGGSVRPDCAMQFWNDAWDNLSNSREVAELFERFRIRHLCNSN